LKYLSEGLKNHASLKALEFNCSCCKKITINGKKEFRDALKSLVLKFNY